MKLKFAVSLAALLSVAPVAARADCVSTLAAGPSPISIGYLAFEGLADGNSFVYIYNFERRKFADTNHWLTVVDAHNPSLSRTGKWIVFMGRPDLASKMRVWAWNPSLSEPIDLTTLSGGNTNVYNEDPKFSFDNRHIIFKQDGAVAIMSVSGLNGSISVGPPSVIEDGVRGTLTEASGPMMSASNRIVYFFRNVTPSEHLERLTLRDFQTVGDVEYDNPDQTETYYPVLSRHGTLFFARHPVNPTGQDTLYSVAPGAKVRDALPIASNLCNADNSDAAPVGDMHLIFSSTLKDPNGLYSLYVADLRGAVWDFSDRPEINQKASNILGSSYAPY